MHAGSVEEVVNGGSGRGRGTKGESDAVSTRPSPMSRRRPDEYVPCRRANPAEVRLRYTCKYTKVSNSVRHTYRLRRRAKTNILHNLERGDRSPLLQVETKPCDCRGRNVVLEDTVETKKRSFDKSRATIVAAFELAFFCWHPRFGDWLVRNSRWR